MTPEEVVSKLVDRLKTEMCWTPNRTLQVRHSYDIASASEKFIVMFPDKYIYVWATLKQLRKDTDGCVEKYVIGPLLNAAKEHAKQCDS